MARPQLMPSVQPTERLVGEAPTIVALRAQLRHLVTFDTLGNPFLPTVLLQGETGTGKGLVARIIHDSGPRAQGPFLEVNCAAIPEALLEAELFGFEAGALTDAKRAKPGLWEAASRGILFLDEIDALPVMLQGKLLTVIEARRVRRLGHLMEWVTLLHPDPLIGPATLEQLRAPLAQSSTPAPTRMPDVDTEAADEATHIRHALQQTAGEEAIQLAGRALMLSSERNLRGQQAWVLRLLGEIGAQRNPTEVEQAEDRYRQALALAEELGIRPLQAHCHYGLGILYLKAGRLALAHAERAAAIALYRAMDMTFWLPQAEAALTRVG